MFSEKTITHVDDKRNFVIFLFLNPLYCDDRSRRKKTLSVSPKLRCRTFSPSSRYISLLYNENYEDKSVVSV